MPKVNSETQTFSPTEFQEAVAALVRAARAGDEAAVDERLRQLLNQNLLEAARKGSASANLATPQDLFDWYKQLSASRSSNSVASGAGGDTEPSSGIKLPANPEGPAAAPSRPFGRFLICDALGSGGAGLVFRAFDSELRREVALKVPKLEMFLSPALASRFFREARLAATLNHPNINPIYDAGELGAVRYIASAYCSGPSLADWLQQSSAGARAISPRLAARWLEILAEAVEYAHSRGIVHRDLKPANVLLEPVPDRPESAGAPPDESGKYTLRITDFGIAKAIEEDATMTATGTVLGTPQYMAPEQASGRGCEIGPATDIYALGTILYEMLCGRPPFQGESPVDVLLQVRMAEPPAPRLLNPSISDDLQTICLKCLEKNPRTRYASAQHLADDLRRYLEHRPILARPTGIPGRLSKWARRRPTIAALTGVLVAAMVFVACGVWWHVVSLKRALDESNTLRAQSEENRVEADAARKLAEERARNLRRQLYPSKIRVAGEAIKLGDARRALELLAELDRDAGEPGLRDFAQRHVDGLCHREELILDGRQGEVYFVTYSPDGKMLATGGEDGSVKFWNSRTGRELATLHRHTRCVNGIAFSPDGRQMVTVSCDKTIRLWDVKTRQEQAILLQGSQAIFAAASIADGRLFATGEDHGTIRIWDPKTGKQLAATAPQDRMRTEWLSGIPHTSRFLCNGDINRALHLWDAQQGLKDVTPHAVSGTLRAAAFSSAGQLVACEVGEGTGGIELMDAKSWKSLGQIGDPLVHASAMEFSPDGELLAIGDSNSFIRIWCVRSRRLRQTFNGHTNRIASLAYSPDGRHLASGSYDRTVRIWQVDRCAGRRAFSAPRGTGRIAFSANGRFLVTQHGRRVVVWETMAWTKRFEIDAVDAFSSAPSAPLEKRTSWKLPLLAVAKGGNVEIWDMASARCLETIHTNCAQVAEVSMTGKTPFLAISAEDHKTAIWKLEAGLSQQTAAPAAGVAVEPPSARPGFAQSRPLCWIGTPQAGYRDGRMAVTPNGQYVFTAQEGARDIEIWDISPFTTANPNRPIFHAASADVPRLRDRAPLYGHRDRIEAMQLSTDGKLLATAGRDNTVRLWDVDSKKELMTFVGHSNWVNTVAFSPDGHTLASGGADRTVRLWDIATKEEMLTLESNLGPFDGVAFSPDGTMLAGLSGQPNADSEIAIWYAPKRRFEMKARNVLSAARN